MGQTSIDWAATFSMNIKKVRCLLPQNNWEPAWVSWH